MQRENYLAIMKTFFMAIVFLVLGSIIGVYFIPPSVRYMMNIAFFIVVLFSLFSRKGGFIKNKPSMYIYAFILGVLTGSTYVYYFVTLGEQVFISAIFGVLLVFGLAYIIAKNSSEEKVFKLSSMIFAGMIALLILEFINIFFFKFGTFDLLLSTGGIIIYSVYAVIIMKSVQSRCRYGKLSEEEVVQLSYSIFISFLNLLLDLLRLLSIINRNND
ncbi:Bax inhibitor-1 family protein [Romboutsia sedimentorum]|uniref:Bax inhibitor-1 family protein n=1 Tax=Romboutsia sedimentorum TaxID=1368474 RepID=A0ABT7E4Y9_9FIRM|nr:Bax inhibitor-1 family protein [Romboutsia sedimentorum]MDK2561984.1 Bax inhibitor-1 family protein [Romboutsia sedimentorum]MDK2586776.1 Bax inhibitor-1 family protein [Romboutsia sedimentorum]